jgi:hypothetical protein
MNSLVGQPPNTPLLVFEEVKPNMVDICRPNLTLRELEISNGDILVFQRTPELRECTAFGLATVPEYYDYILNRVTVKFRRLDQPRKDAFTLELSKKMLYDQVIPFLPLSLSLFLFLSEIQRLRITVCVMVTAAKRHFYLNSLPFSSPKEGALRLSSFLFSFSSLGTPLPAPLSQLFNLCLYSTFR